MTGHRKTQTPEFFSGWKEIANYLGKGVRTVQRYEWQLGLPVRRPAGKPRGSVVATKAELDAWVSASPMRDTYQLTRPPLDPQLADSANAIRTGIAEMRRLRSQMTDLRADLRKSLALLHRSVQHLSGGLRPDGWREPVQFTFPENDLRNLRTLDFLLVGDRRRAS
jgi:hypothetical protein